MSEDIESEVIETAYSKGLNLEKEFCEFLKTDLKWDKARIRPQLASRHNMRGTNVDILAERLDHRGKTIKTISFVYGLVFAILFFLGWIDQDVERGSILVGFSLFFEVIGIIAYFVGLSLSKQNGWVECKNLKGKVNINQVQKTIDEVRHYRQSSDRDYKITHVYFVSTNGYVENALKLAVENDIKCYVKESQTFKEVDYWNH
jgi:hypothetical protein